MKKRIIALLLCLLLAIPLAACGNNNNPDLCANGHDWGEWATVTEATETTDGLNERECRRCGEKDSDTIPKIGSGTTELTPEQTVAKMREIIGGTLDAIGENTLLSLTTPLFMPLSSVVATSEEGSNNSDFNIGAAIALQRQNELSYAAALTVSEILLKTQETAALNAKFTISDSVRTGLPVKSENRVSQLANRFDDYGFNTVEIFAWIVDSFNTVEIIGLDGTTVFIRLKYIFDETSASTVAIWQDEERFGMSIVADITQQTERSVSVVSFDGECDTAKIISAPVKDGVIEKIIRQVSVNGVFEETYADRGSAGFPELEQELNQHISEMESAIAAFPAKESTVEWIFE